MRLSHSQVLNAPIDHVWANFMDLEVVGRCFPGATVTEVEGDDFVGNIRSRLGPLTVWFDGKGTLTERRHDGHRARIEATGHERHGLGKATITVAVVLSHAEGHTEERPATRARMTTDLHFYGSALEVGRGLVQRASDPLVERFLTGWAAPTPRPQPARTTATRSTSGAPRPTCSAPSPAVDGVARDFSMRVAVVGASGYVGSRLVPELLRRDHDVVATHHRSPSTAYPWSDDVEWRRVDVHDEAAVVGALSEVDAICYLVHGLDDPDFMRLDRQAADNVAYAAGVVGASRLVYFSGIVPDLPPEELSDHLLSRLEVEQILATAGTSVLTLRASMVVGAGSTSFEVMRQTSQRLGVVQTVPAWMGSSMIQPVSVTDAVYYLAEALERTEVTGHLDVVGPDRLSYLALLRTYAGAARLLRVQLPVWLAPVDIVARVAGRLVDVPAPRRRVAHPEPRARHGGRPRRRRCAR